MDYNTQRPGLILREYGRNVQHMVEHLLTIEDEDRRNKAARALIELMGQINPHLRIEEFKPMLWDHIYMMSGYKLEVDFPYDMVEPDEIPQHPKRPDYPKNTVRMMQYGKNVETLIAKAVEMEDEEKKIAFAKAIGNYMKMVCQTRYNENVDDEQIIDDLKRLSKGELVIDEESNLDKLSRSNSHKKRYTSNNRNRSGSGRNDRRSYSKTNGKFDRNGRRNGGFKKRNK